MVGKVVKKTGSTVQARGVLQVNFAVVVVMWEK